jgi:L-malate glycosyltransferase
MRILFVNHTGAASGAEAALMRLIEALRSEHAVALACPSDGPFPKVAEAAGVERYPVPAVEPSLRPHPIHTPVGIGRSLWAGVALAGVARRFRADLVHANTPRAGLMGAVALRFGGPPLVVRVHEQLTMNLLGRAARAIVARSASAVVTVSEDTARRFNDGLDHPIATHVYNSFDRERFDPERVAPAPVREELGIAPDAPLLVHVAQITPWKGQDTSIRALAELRRQGVDAHLLVVGEIAFAAKTVRFDNAAFLRELHRLVDELAVGDAVHFLGSRDDVPGILRAADLSLLPSWYEPFANVMLESMAMGTPLLGTEVGGAPELVVDRVSGRLLPPRRAHVWAAAAGELLGDRPALARMGERAREGIEGFDDETHARDMLAVYRRVLGSEDSVPAPRDPVGAA